MPFGRLPRIIVRSPQRGWQRRPRCGELEEERQPESERLTCLEEKECGHVDQRDPLRDGGKPIQIGTGVPGVPDERDVRCCVDHERDVAAQCQHSMRDTDVIHWPALAVDMSTMECSIVPLPISTSPPSSLLSCASSM